MGLDDDRGLRRAEEDPRTLRFRTYWSVSALLWGRPRQGPPVGQERDREARFDQINMQRSFEGDRQDDSHDARRREGQALHPRVRLALQETDWKYGLVPQDLIDEADAWAKKDLE